MGRQSLSIDSQKVKSEKQQFCNSIDIFWYLQRRYLGFKSLFPLPIIAIKYIKRRSGEPLLHIEPKMVVLKDRTSIKSLIDPWIA